MGSYLFGHADSYAKVLETYIDAENIEYKRLAGQCPNSKDFRILITDLDANQTVNIIFGTKEVIKTKFTELLNKLREIND